VLERGDTAAVSAIENALVSVGRDKLSLPENCGRLNALSSDPLLDESKQRFDGMS
jgi:hypothetical protein